MNFRDHRRRRGDQADLEITPLIDVVFLLLIFFMLTSTFARKEAGPTDQISVDLPRASADSRSEANTPVVIVVGSDDEIEVRGVRADAGGSEASIRQLASGEEVVSVLREVQSRRPEAPILLTGDRKASHGRIIELLGQLREAGFREVQIATQPTESQ
jgi:biopolymer transport protein ExbD